MVCESVINRYDPVSLFTLFDKGKDNQTINKWDRDRHMKYEGRED